MKRLVGISCLAFALVACGAETPSAEQEQQNRAMAEEVRAVNAAGPPVQELVPDPILYPDIEAHDLFGVSCAYAPGTSLGARVIAREVDAYMKINGEMIRFAADPGARELEAATRSLYNGREYSLRLEISADGREVGDGGTQRFEGTIWLRDRFDRVVYTASGIVDCGA